VPEPKTAGPRRADFRGSSLLTAAELRRARLKHDEFVRALATRLSIYLRLEFHGQVGALHILPQPKLTERLPNPAHLTLFRLEPLTGVGLLALPLPLSTALLDRLLGGAGQAGDSARPLTEIDVSLLDLLAQLVLKEWGQSVAGLPEAHPELLAHETNPRFVPTAASNVQWLVLELSARLGECAETMWLAFPFGMVESVLRRPDPALALRPPPSPEATPALRWHPALDAVPVPLSAGWEGLRITAEQLAHLKVGDVLPLEPQRFNEVEVRLARVPKFVGRLGAARQARAVELTRPLPGQETIPS
jgi:flagellar motor switch protein FliM